MRFTYGLLIGLVCLLPLPHITLAGEATKLQSPAGDTAQHSKSRVKWVYEGCAAYPVTVDAQAQETRLPWETQAKAETKLQAPLRAENAGTSTVKRLQ